MFDFVWLNILCFKLPINNFAVKWEPGTGHSKRGRKQRNRPVAKCTFHRLVHLSASSCNAATLSIARAQNFPIAKVSLFSAYKFSFTGI